MATVIQSGKCSDPSLHLGTQSGLCIPEQSWQHGQLITSVSGGVGRSHRSLEGVFRTGKKRRQGSGVRGLICFNGLYPAGDGSPLPSGLTMPADVREGGLRGMNLEPRPVKGPLQLSGQEMMEDPGAAAERESGGEDTDLSNIWKLELSGWCRVKDSGDSRTPSTGDWMVDVAPTGLKIQGQQCSVTLNWRHMCGIENTWLWRLWQVWAEGRDLGAISM